MRINFISNNLICVILLAACMGSGGDTEDIRNLISNFESAVNDLDSNLLSGLVSQEAEDYDLIAEGSYFGSSNNGELFSLYSMTYADEVISVNGENATASTSVVAVNRETLQPVSFPITATFTLIREDGSWVIRQLQQVRVNNGDEEIILNEIDMEFYALLNKYRDGKILR